jgi:hypothetical protein
VFPTLVVVSALGGGLSCSGDTLNGPPPLSPTQAYWALQLTQHAVNLALTAPYDTVQLTAIPRNELGALLTVGFGPATYLPADSSVTVTTTGLVTAKQVTSSGPTYVIANLQDTLHNVTHADTVFLNITQTASPLPLRTFSLQPVLGDSAKRAVDFIPNGGFSLGIGGFNWNVTAIDAEGDTLCNENACGLTVLYGSSDQAIASIDPLSGMVTTFDTGRVVFTVTAMVYGMLMSDSVVFSVGNPIFPLVLINDEAIAGNFLKGFDTIKSVDWGVGCVVTFWNRGIYPINVEFDRPTDMGAGGGYQILFGPVIPPNGSGDIPKFGGVMFDQFGEGDPLTNLSNFASRRFTKPGVYHYYSTSFPSDTFEVNIK